MFDWRQSSAQPIAVLSSIVVMVSFITLFIVVVIIIYVKRRDYAELYEHLRIRLLAYVHPNGALPERLLL